MASFPMQFLREFRGQAASASLAGLVADWFGVAANVGGLTWSCHPQPRSGLCISSSDLKSRFPCEFPRSFTHYRVPEIFTTTQVRTPRSQRRWERNQPAHCAADFPANHSRGCNDYELLRRGATQCEDVDGNFVALPGCVRCVLRSKRDERGQVRVVT